MVYHNPEHHPFHSDHEDAEQKLDGNETQTNILEYIRSPGIC